MWEIIKARVSRTVITRVAGGLNFLRIYLEFLVPLTMTEFPAIDAPFSV